MLEDGQQVDIAIANADEIRKFDPQRAFVQKQQLDQEIDLQIQGLNLDDMLTSLDSQGNLHLNEQALATQRNRSLEFFSSKNADYARSVSFIGSTQAGKSTIIDALMDQEKGPGDARPQIAQDISSTTSGVQTYNCELKAVESGLRRMKRDFGCVGVY